jgi:hypothetical protein
MFLRIILFALLLISLNGFSQYNSYFNEQIFDEQLEDIKISIESIALAQSDTVRLNKLYEKLQLPIRSDSLVQNSQIEYYQNLYKTRLLNGVNYLISSESISYDSIVVRMSRHTSMSKFVELFIESDLNVIRTNSLLLSMVELGFVYNNNTKGFEYKDVWIEEILDYSHIDDGDRILIKGPTMSLGLILVMTSVKFPNSEVVAIAPNSNLKKKYISHIKEFDSIVNMNNLSVVIQKELQSSEFDKILSILNIESAEELEESAPLYSNLMAKKSELIYFDFEKEEFGCSECPGQISSQEVKRILRKNKIKEVHDASFFDIQLSNRKYIVKTFEK